MKIWVDTDIGSEIDDALALAYLLSKSAVDIVGISVVTEHSQTRAKLASAICRAAGRPDIPIYLGREKSLDGRDFGQTVSQAAALKSLDHQTHFESGDAVERLRETIDNNRNEVILLALGPLSNVAELIVSHPEIPQRLRCLVTMCGNFTRPAKDAKAIEWNAQLDPVAADIVFRTRVTGGMYLVSLDTTRHLSVPIEDLTTQELPPVLEAVLKLQQAKADGKRALTMYDTAAAIIAVNRHAWDLERGRAIVDLQEERGATDWEPDHNGAHLRVKSISVQTILREFCCAFKLNGGHAKCESA